MTKDSALHNQPDTAEDRDNGDEECQTTVAIVNLIRHRLDREDFLNAKDRESIAYRLAEVMMCAKDLYTKRLRCLTADSEEREQMGLLGEDTPPEDPEKPAEAGEAAQDFSVFNDLAYTRMHLIRLRDLISDFDGSFLEAMAAQREDEGCDETWLQEAEWNEEELGEIPEDGGSVSDEDAWARSDDEQ